jgi:hypothetical protein
MGQTGPKGLMSQHNSLFKQFNTKDQSGIVTSADKLPKLTELLIEKKLRLVSIKPDCNKNIMCENWILDSGATDHMTGNVNLRKIYNKIENDQFFRIVNDGKIKIKG